MRVLFLILFLTFSHSVVADRAQDASVALIIIDYFQTKEVVKNPDYDEWLGLYKKQRHVNIGFALQLAGHWWMNDHLIYKKDRTSYNRIIAITRLIAVIHNRSIGIKIGF